MEDITHEEAVKAKETLIKYLEQNVCVECEDLERYPERTLLYLALKTNEVI